MDIRKVKKLIEMLEESNLTEIEIVEGEESVRLSRGGGYAMPQPGPQFVTAGPGEAIQLFHDFLQGAVTVLIRLPSAEQIQVGAVDD